MDMRPKINNKLFYITLAILFVAQVLMSMQGLDVCDSGFYATTYANVFDNPDCVEYNFMYYFAGVVGGAFLKAFPWAGLLGLRVFGALVLSGSVWVCYRILRRFVDTRILCLSYVLIFAFLSNAPYEFAHNMLTTLLFLSAVWALLKGLELNRYGWIALSGAILVFESFTRLPNFLHPLVGIVILIHAAYHRENIKVWGSRLGVFIGAYAMMFGLFLLGMKALGHTDNFMRAIDVVRSMGSNPDETHGVGNLIRVNIHAYFQVIKLSCIFGLILFGGAGALTRVKSRLLSGLCQGMLFLVSLFVLKTFNTPEIAYALSLVPLAVALWVFRADKQFSILCWTALFMALVLPVGSDGAIYNFGMSAVWLSLGLGLGLIHVFLQQDCSWEISSGRARFGVTMTARGMKRVAWIFVIALGILLVKRVIFNGTYFELVSRFDQTVCVNNPRVRGIYTTPARAKLIQEALDAVRPYVKEGDYLFCYESFPMIHYLTGTKPYIYMSWPLIYDGQTLEKQIRRAENEIPQLPVVLRLKFNTLGSFSAPDSHYLDDDRVAGTYSSEGETNVYNDFLRRHNYRVVWSNDYFDIQLPGQPI